MPQDGRIPAFSESTTTNAIGKTPAPSLTRGYFFELVGGIPDHCEGVRIILTSRTAEVRVELLGPEFRGSEAQGNVGLLRRFADAIPACTEFKAARVNAE